MPPDPPQPAAGRGSGGAGELGGSVRARREQLGWSQSRLARASGVSRTVVNEVENGRRSPSLPTYDKLRRALGLDLGLDLASSLALLPTATPASPSERFLTTVAGLLITAGRLELADAAAALQVDATAVRTAVAQLADRLAAVGVAAVDDGVTIELTVLGYACQAVERIRPLEAVPTLTTEAVMTLVIVGHLGEATRRDVDERRGADSTSVLDRLAAPRPTDPTHRPGRQRTTQRLPTHHPRTDSGRPRHPGVLPNLVPPTDEPHRSASPRARYSVQPTDTATRVNSGRIRPDTRSLERGVRLVTTLVRLGMIRSGQRPELGWYRHPPPSQRRSSGVMA